MSSQAGYAGSNNYYQTDAPPVPPLPRNHRSPSTTPISDVFSSAPSTPDVSKPLPPSPMKKVQHEEPDKVEPAVIDDDDDASMVVVESSSSFSFPSERSSSPDRTIKSKSPRTLAQIAARTKRRSMSVSEVDMKAIMGSGSAEGPQPPRRKKWDSGINGVMVDFTGQLSEQLDGISSGSLDLKDPSTPKRPTFGFESGGQAQRRHSSDQRALRSTASSSPIATKPKMSFDVQTEESDFGTAIEDSPNSITRSTTPVEDAIAPPRLSSLSTPLRQTSSHTPLGSTSRGGSIKYGPRQHRPGGSISSQGGSNSNPGTIGRDGMRLRVQHKSTASASEPALVPIRDEIRDRDHKHTVRLVPSSPSVGWPETTSAISVSISSQTDLTGEDGFTSRKASSAPSRDESSGADLDARGQDLATKCWTEDEDFLARDKIAEWLGGT